MYAIINMHVGGTHTDMEYVYVAAFVGAFFIDFGIANLGGGSSWW